jgi:hypothetical protein
LRVGPEGTTSQDLLTEIVESPVAPEHQPPAYFIGTKVTVVIDRMTEITWIGDSDFHVGGYVDVYPAEDQTVQPDGRVVAAQIQLQNATGEIFRP